LAADAQPQTAYPDRLPSWILREVRGEKRRNRKGVSTRDGRNWTHQVWGEIAAPAYLPMHLQTTSTGERRYVEDIKTYDNSIQENSGIFFAIRMHQLPSERHTGSKKLFQYKLPVLKGDTV